MFARNRSIPRIAATIVVAAGLTMGGALPAFASDGTTAKVTGGSLSITNPTVAAFADKTITGVDQTTTAAMDAFSVSDLTGSGDGWHVMAQATQFTGTTHNLAVGSLKMSAPTVDPNGTNSPEPTVASGPYTIDNGAVEIASADVDEGMGIYDFSATTLTLSLPADVYADNGYASTVTISVITAP